MQARRPRSGKCASRFEAVRLRRDLADRAKPSLLLACALLLSRNMRARLSSFRKADCDGLFAAFHLLARTSASKRATLSFVHGAFHFAACAALTLGSHTKPRQAALDCDCNSRLRASNSSPRASRSISDFFASANMPPGFSSSLTWCLIISESTVTFASK